MKAPIPKVDFFPIHDLNYFIKKHLDEPDLSVKRLVHFVGVSRTDLHRKLMSITGMSATKYVRHLRLTRASELLVEQPEWSIYQIALEVGFVNEGYFYKRFKECFGCCPAAYRKRMKKLEHTCRFDREKGKTFGG